ncbi:MAG TPA: hypothetical protein ENJ09_10975 [Planctomycetes bacterium]|nr:hypothetical protein [Planctomycetota bacterium]
MRTTGLLVLISRLSTFVSETQARHGWGLFSTFLLFLVGGYLLRGAPFVIEMAYPSRKRERRGSKRAETLPA